MFDLDRYKQWAQAYPESIFKEPKGSSIDNTGDYSTKEKRLLITRASASMGRHMAEKALLPMIAEIERLRAEREAMPLVSTTTIKLGERLAKKEARISRLTTALKSIATADHKANRYHMMATARQALFRPPKQSKPEPTRCGDNCRWDVVGTNATCMDCGVLQPKMEGGVVGPQWEPDYDPTPWCHACKAIDADQCTCLPIAENN
jgi:hypothetical protein